MPAISSDKRERVVTTVKGKVVNLANLPISGSKVSVLDKKNSLYMVTWTNDDGSWCLDLSPGEYVIFDAVGGSREVSIPLSQFFFVDNIVI